jgi:SAM-dependent methyltransferase
VQTAGSVLDVGCGLAAPALRIARRYGCSVTGVNISREQVRQGRELIATRGLSARVSMRRGDARALELGDRSFDAIPSPFGSTATTALGSFTDCGDCRSLSRPSTTTLELWWECLADGVHGLLRSVATRTSARTWAEA